VETREALLSVRPRKKSVWRIERRKAHPLLLPHSRKTGSRDNASAQDLRDTGAANSRDMEDASNRDRDAGSSRDREGDAGNPSNCNPRGGEWN
jgi:hypothetical protein